ncbi:unnamed protein product [Closterium sp. Naga37s-1]|nr:unnamed protein product [Closterium sp. Naga37s-1]
MSGVAGFGMASELAATLASQALQENGLPPGLLPLQEVVQSTNTRTGPFHRNDLSRKNHKSQGSSREKIDVVAVC